MLVTCGWTLLEQPNKDLHRRRKHAASTLTQQQPSSDQAAISFHQKPHYESEPHDTGAPPLPIAGGSVTWARGGKTEDRVVEIPHLPLSDLAVHRATPIGNLCKMSHQNSLCPTLYCGTSRLTLHCYDVIWKRPIKVRNLKPLSLFLFFFALACKRLIIKTHSVESRCYGKIQ